jgi:hypothetical protein
MGRTSRMPSTRPYWVLLAGTPPVRGRTCLVLVGAYEPATRNPDDAAAGIVHTPTCACHPPWHTRAERQLQRAASRCRAMRVLTGSRTLSVSTTRTAQVNPPTESGDNWRGRCIGRTEDSDSIFGPLGNKLWVSPNPHCRNTVCPWDSTCRVPGIVACNHRSPRSMTSRFRYSDRYTRRLRDNILLRMPDPWDNTCR